MEDVVTSMTGYHGTCSSAISSIKKYGLDPDKVKYRDDHWLGQGVYFFEDWNKAMWWAGDIAGKSWNQGSFPVIYKANIVAKQSEILDLDDEKTLDLFYTRILEAVNEIEAEIKEDPRGKYPVFTEKQFRAVYFDYYKQKYGISVISYSFRKDSIKYGVFRNAESIKKQRRLVKALGVAYKEKQICVSKKECITNIVEAYNGENEVI